MQRITRHDKLWSFGLLGLGTAIGTPFIGEIIMFGFPILFAFIGGMHQDYRYRRSMGGQLTQEIDDVTSNVPFVAVLNGSQKVNDILDEVKGVNLLFALAIAAALYRRRINRLKHINLL
jgi:uncharacterized membrane protein